MIERLDAETRVHHVDAEAELDPLFRCDVVAAHYLVFLMRTYGFEAPLESAVALTPRIEHVIAPRPRARAGLLARDLMALGLRPHEVASLPMCLAIPQFRGAVEALGWMYVVERSMLAHSVIRRHLMTRLPAEVERASAYLRAHEGVAGTRWQELGAALDEVASQPAIADRIVAAAGEAFRCRRSWSSSERGAALARGAT